MTTFPDLEKFQSEVHHDTLTLPVGGKKYSFVGSLSIERGLQFQQMREEGRRILEAAQNNEKYEPSQQVRELLDALDGNNLYLELIGDDQLAQLKADGVDYDTMIHIGVTLYSWYVAGESVAKRVWTRGTLEDDDVRPPAKSSATSARPRTSPKKSTTKQRNGSAPRRTRGATSSSGGNSSKPTSRASTK